MQRIIQTIQARRQETFRRVGETHGVDGSDLGASSFADFVNHVFDNIAADVKLLHQLRLCAHQDISADGHVLALQCIPADWLQRHPLERALRHRSTKQSCPRALSKARLYRGSSERRNGDVYTHQTFPDSCRSLLRSARAVPSKGLKFRQGEWRVGGGTIYPLLFIIIHLAPNMGGIGASGTA